MKIMNLEQFRALPSATLYCKLDGDCLGPLGTKGDTWEVDFLCAEVCGLDHEIIEAKDAAEHEGKLVGHEFRLNHEFYGRDGLFDRDQLFAVFDGVDIDRLVAHLLECRRAAP